MQTSEINPLVVLLNNKPLDIFDGLSPNEMHSLLYETFEERSPLRFRDSIENEVLDLSPFFRLCEELLFLVRRDGTLKLTPKGNLPRRTVLELYGHRILLDDIVESGIRKLLREENWWAIRVARLIVELSRLVRKANNKLMLTKKGSELLLKHNRDELFRRILRAYVVDFNWAYNDRFGEVPIGQFGIGFTLVLLIRYGASNQEVRFYADKYRVAFPRLLNELPVFPFDEPIDNFYSCYASRVFSKFLCWFGFVPPKEPKDFFVSIGQVTSKSGILDSVFLVDSSA